MNLLPVFALLLAQRQGDSTPDAGRAALIAALVRPPLLGLLLAVSLSSQAPKPLNATAIRRALKFMTKEDVKQIGKLIDAVRALHRAVRDANDAIAKGCAVLESQGGRALGVRKSAGRSSSRKDRRTGNSGTRALGGARGRPR